MHFVSFRLTVIGYSMHRHVKSLHLFTLLLSSYLHPHSISSKVSVWCAPEIELKRKKKTMLKDADKLRINWNRCFVCLILNLTLVVVVFRNFFDIFIACDNAWGRWNGRQRMKMTQLTLVLFVDTFCTLFSHDLLNGVHSHRPKTNLQTQFKFQHSEPFKIVSI